MFNVRYIFTDNSPGMFGWSDRVESVATFAEAIAKMDALMPRRCFEVQVSNPADNAKLAWRIRNRKTGKQTERFVQGETL